MDTLIKDDAVINLYEDDLIRDETNLNNNNNNNNSNNVEIVDTLIELNTIESNNTIESSLPSDILESIVDDEEIDDFLLFNSVDDFFDLDCIEDSENDLKKSVELADVKIILNSHTKSKSRKQLGEGTFAKVYLGMKGSEFVALKVPRDDTDYIIEDKAKENMKQEIEILKEFDDENIIKIYDYETEKNFVYYTMEYMGENASLRNFMDDNHEKHPLTEKSIKSITRQLTRAISVMHKKCVVHGDIKSDNLLLKQISNGDSDDQEFTVKLIDFGSAKKFPPNEYLNEIIYGTEYTMAPELLPMDGNYKYNNKIDIWSIGCIVIEMHTGIRKPTWGRKPSYPPNLTSDEKDFLDHCFEKEPEKRFTAEQLLKHKFLQENKK